MKKLEEELKQYAKSDYYPFHMPGHKRRQNPWEVENLYEVDITEIDGFDNLHDAKEILLEEEQRAGMFYQTEETLFSVNGSTACILSAVSAAVKRNGKILIARNCHKAVYHGAYLRGLEVFYVYPPISEDGIALGIQPEDVEKALLEEPEIEAVLITSPTYEGVVSDIEAIAEICHKYEIPLIVDEAHGAHFGLHPYFPETAIRCGADVVIQSLHKTLPAMTQTALLHCVTKRVSAETLHRFMRIYQSSSPSYVLMGSITACLHLLMEEGPRLFDDYVAHLKECREGLHGLHHFSLFEVSGMDPSKLVLLPNGNGNTMTGEELYAILRDDYHLQLEMALPNLALAMTSVGDDKAGLDKLCEAMEELDGKCQGVRK